MHAYITPSHNRPSPLHHTQGPPAVGDKLLIADMSSNFCSKPVDVSKVCVRSGVGVRVLRTDRASCVGIAVPGGCESHALACMAPFVFLVLARALAVDVRTCALLAASLPTSPSLPLSFPLQQYGLIYAGAQKNIGPAGVTIVIIRTDLMGNAR